MLLLTKLLDRLVRRGELIVSDAAGRIHQFGTPDPAREPVAIRFTDAATPTRSVFSPRLGVGEAFKTFGDDELLKEMLEGWPFFRATLDNLEMVLAKSDMGIAGLYAGLIEDETLRRSAFGRIKSSWQETHDRLLAITGQSRLLESKPALEASIRLRLPYIEPLNILQIELLKRHRSGETDPRIREGIQLSINAVATALRNSG